MNTVTKSNTIKHTIEVDEIEYNLVIDYSITGVDVSIFDTLDPRNEPDLSWEIKSVEIKGVNVDFRCLDNELRAEIKEVAWNGEDEEMIIAKIEKDIEDDC